MGEFLGLTYNEKRPEYIGKPLELYAKVADQTEQTYKQNRAMSNALDMLAKNTQVLSGADFIKDAALSDIDNKLKTIRDSGDYLHSSYIIDDAARDFATNPALNAAKMDYAKKMTHIEEINKSDLLQEDKDKALSVADKMYQDRIAIYANEYKATGDLSKFKGAYSPYTPTKYTDPHKLVKDIIGTVYKDEQTGRIEIGNDVDANILTKSGFHLKYANEAELQRDIIKFLNSNKEFLAGAESQNFMDTYGKEYNINEIQRLANTYTRQHRIDEVVTKDGMPVTDIHGRQKYNIKQTEDSNKDYEEDLTEIYNNFVQQLATKAGKPIDDRTQYFSFDGLDNDLQNKIINESYRILDYNSKNAKRINAAAEVGAGVYGFNAITKDASQSHYGTSTLTDKANKVLENLVLPTTSNYSIDNNGISRTYQHGFLNQAINIKNDKGNRITNLSNGLKTKVVDNANSLNVVDKFGNYSSNRNNPTAQKSVGLGIWIKQMADKGFLYSENQINVEKYNVELYKERLNELSEDYSDENGFNPTGKDLQMLQDAAKEMSKNKEAVQYNPSYGGTLTASNLDLTKTRVNLGYTAHPITGDIVSNVELYDNHNNRMYYKDVDYDGNETGEMKSSILVTDVNTDDTRNRAVEMADELLNQAVQAVTYSQRLGKFMNTERFANMIVPALDVVGQLGGKDAIPKIHKKETELIKQFNANTDKEKTVKDFSDIVYVDLTHNKLMKDAPSVGITNAKSIPIRVFADGSVILMDNAKEPIERFANYSDMLRYLGGNKIITSEQYLPLNNIINTLK
jgi:hypothetical protein